MTQQEYIYLTLAQGWSCRGPVSLSFSSMMIDPSSAVAILLLGRIFDPNLLLALGCVMLAGLVCMST